jgi:histidyl-tRNA synthetase
VFVVCGDGDAAFDLTLELRRHRISAQFDLAGRAFKGQMKQADRSGARFAVILELDGSAKLREMESGDQRDVDRAELPVLVIAAREA